MWPGADIIGDKGEIVCCQSCLGVVIALDSALLRNFQGTAWPLDQHPRRSGKDLGGVRGLFHRRGACRCSTTLTSLSVGGLKQRGLL